MSKMSQLEYVVRKPHFIGENDESLRVILPKIFVDAIGFQKGDYAKCSLEGNKILIERLVAKQ